MTLITVTVDNRKVEVEEGSTVLEAARKAGITIPTLCAMSEIGHTPGACRVCVTEVEGQRTLVAPVSFPSAGGW